MVQTFLSGFFSWPDFEALQNGDKLAKMLFSLNRFQRTFLAIHFNDFHSQQQKKGLRHRPYYYLKYKPSLVFLYFTDDFEESLLQQYVNLYLSHANYLTSYSLSEIGLIGKAHNATKYAFGYIQNIEKPNIEMVAEQEETFKALKLKLRTDLTADDLTPSEIPFEPLAGSPF